MHEMKRRSDYPSAVRFYPPIKQRLADMAAGTRNWFINLAVGAMMGLHEHELEPYRRKTNDEQEGDE